MLDDEHACLLGEGVSFFTSPKRRTVQPSVATKTLLDEGHVHLGAAWSAPARALCLREGARVRGAATVAAGAAPPAMPHSPLAD